MDLELPTQNYTYSPCTVAGNNTGVATLNLRMVGTRAPGNDSYVVFTGDETVDDDSDGLVTETISQWVWRRCTLG